MPKNSRRNREFSEREHRRSRYAEKRGGYEWSPPEIPDPPPEAPPSIEPPPPPERPWPDPPSGLTSEDLDRTGASVYRQMVESATEHITGVFVQGRVKKSDSWRATTRRIVYILGLVMEDAGWGPAEYWRRMAIRQAEERVAEADREHSR